MSTETASPRSSPEPRQQCFFEHVWGKAAGALFLEGRLYFYQLDGTRAKGNSGGPSVLLAYGEENARLLRDCALNGAYCTTIARHR